jgi:hypothetical protein
MWIKVHKRRQSIYTGDEGQCPENRKTSTCFWVDCDISIPTPRCTSDEVLFILTIPLTDEEIISENVIKLISDGSFQHTMTEQQVIDWEAKQIDDALYAPKPRMEIINNIMEGLDQSGKVAMMRIIRKYTDFIICLDNYDYSGISVPIGDALTAGDVNQQMVDYILSKIPKVR